MKAAMLAYSFLLLGLLITTTSGTHDCSTNCPDGQKFSCFELEGTCSCTCAVTSKPCDDLRANECPEGYFRRCRSDINGCSCRCGMESSRREVEACQKWHCFTMVPSSMAKSA